MPAKGLLKICELDETYAKLLTVSMATFRDNKQVLYGISSMFLQLPIHCKTASVFMQNYCICWKQPKKQKLTLSSSQHVHIIQVQM